MPDMSGLCFHGRHGLCDGCGCAHHAAEARARAIPYTGPKYGDGEHYDGCPCGRCQAIRGARDPGPLPIAFLPCCGASLKLTRTADGYAGTETHLDHCKAR